MGASVGQNLTISRLAVQVRVGGGAVTVVDVIFLVRDGVENLDS